MAGNSPGRAQYTVECSCGAKHTLDARQFGKPRPCRCGATLTVAWGRDPKNYKAVPVAMIKPKGPTLAPKGSTTAFCGCGFSRAVAPAEKNPTLRCPTCGNLMAVDRQGGPAGQQVQVRSKFSAPLLPLHVKKTLTTQVMKGAPFFICACGMRILIREGMEGSRIQCPECDQFHVLDFGTPEAPPPPPMAAPRRQAPAPKAPPAPKVSPAPAPTPSKPLGLGEFLCQCGEVQPPRTSRTGREFTCKTCGRRGRVETDKDPKTGLPVMRPVFTSGPAAPPPPPAPRAPAPQPAPPAPPPEGEVSFEELDPFEAVFETAAGSVHGGAPPAVEGDAQAVPCACGAEILLSAADVGHTIQCPACADTMIVERSTDARTGAVRITLRVVGGPDDPDWKLEEFQ